MKYLRLILSIIIMLICFTKLYAQNANHKAKALSKPFPSFAKGKLVASIAVGIPNIEMHSFVFPEKTISQDLFGFSPCYATAEYGVSSQLGIAIDFLFNQYSIKYQTYDYNSGNPISFVRGGKISLYGGGLALNYHFTHFMKDYHFDPYLIAGCWAGVEYHFNDYDQHANFSKTLVYPQLRIGMRYYVDKNIAIKLEAGYDWLSIVRLGFSYRFLYAH